MKLREAECPNPLCNNKVKPYSLRIPEDEGYAEYAYRCLECGRQWKDQYDIPDVREIGRPTAFSSLSPFENNLGEPDRRIMS